MSQVLPPNPLGSATASPGQTLAKAVVPYKKPTAIGRIGSISLILVSMLLVLSTGGTHAGDDSVFPQAVKMFAGVGATVMFVASVLLYWRKRLPIPISLGFIMLTTIVPTTPLPMLIALPSAVTAARGPRAWWLIVGSYIATCVSFVWDLLSGTSYIGILAGDPAPAAGTPERLVLFWTLPLLAALVVLPFAAVGLGKRVRNERDAAQRETVFAEQNVRALHREVEIEQHRRELARELHDTLAANLSTLSLHAGALEMTVGDESERAQQAARAVRESAQNSLDDLRNVVRELRNPQLPASTHKGLLDLPELIDEATRAGTDVRVQFYVSDPQLCDPMAAHAVYRLVQEAISNVRRHAPGAALYLHLRGGPGVGIHIQATNWLVPNKQLMGSTTGGGHGLPGMAERVEMLDGAFQAGTTTEGAFAIAAWVPWLTATHPAIQSGA